MKIAASFYLGLAILLFYI